MDIDIVMLVVPPELDIAAAQRELDALDLSALVGGDDGSPLEFPLDEGDERVSDAAAGAIRDHADRWLAAFVRLLVGEDPWFESRIARRTPLDQGRTLLTVALDLDKDQPQYEHVLSLAEQHYAPIVRALGVRVPGSFDLQVATGP